MSLSLRLCQRGILRLQGIRSISVTRCCRKIALESKPYVPPIVEGHDEKNMRLGRPQSPHITIYKFQLPAVLSISHRITGVALSGYISALGIASFMINRPMMDFITQISTNYPSFFILLKFGLIFPFTYHFFNGIRHLVWDTGTGLTIKGVNTSGYIVMLTTALVISALYYWAYLVKEEQKRAEELRREEDRKKAEAEELARVAEEKERDKKMKKKK